MLPTTLTKEHTAMTQPAVVKTQQAILDAAVRCYQRDGIANTAMNSIALEANIGRTTLYRYFANQNSILIQAIIRDIDQISAELADCLEQHSSIDEKIVEGMLFCLTAFARKPVLGLMLGSDNAHLLLELGFKAGDMQSIATSLTKPIYQQAQTEQRLRNNLSLTDFIQWLARILLSMHSHPGPAGLNERRAYLHQFLIPSVLSDHSL